jgi:sarcosine oxidase subunit gamma
MARSFLRRSALAHLGLAARAREHELTADEGNAVATPGVMMGERPFRGLVNLRGPADDAGFHGAIEAALGFTLPLEPNTAAGDGDLRALWLGPDEWWVVSPGDGPGVAERLRGALAGHKAAVTDVSESRTCIEIRGERARDVLAKGCSLDLHPRSFAAGQCAQSLCAKATVTLHLTSGDDQDGGPVFDIYVLNSFAEYLWRWLEDAAREFGSRVTPE